MKMLLSAVLRDEDSEPQAVLDWLVETTRKMGAPSEQAHLLPYQALTGAEMLLGAVLTFERAERDPERLAGATMELLDKAAGKAGFSMPLILVTAYPTPAAPDPTLTEVGIPARPAPGPYGYTGGDTP